MKTKNNKIYENKILNIKNSSFIIVKYIILFLILLCTPLTNLGCSSIMGNGDDKPADVEIPDDPLQRAAINGLITSYRESTMWQIQNVKTLNTTPMAPSGELLELQDPKEVYCVCLEYEARYKVTWSTSEGSPWEKTVRNILVIKTQGDQYLAVKPMNICTPFC
jgi:hypothetical protein